LWLLQSADALRRPERFAQLLDVCAVDAQGAVKATFAAAERLRKALAAAQSVDAGAIAKRVSGPRGIKEKVAQARIEAIRKALAARKQAVKRTVKKGKKK